MRWTNVPPTSDGWYWAQRSRNEAPEIVEVVLNKPHYPDPGTGLLPDGFMPDPWPVSRMGSEDRGSLREFEFWSETPIPEPHWGPAMEEEG